MAANFSEEFQNVQNVVVLTDGGTTNLQYEPSSNVSYLKICSLMKGDIYLNSESDLHNHTEVEVDELKNYASCILDVDIEKGKEEEILKFCDESVSNLKSDDYLTRALQKEICLQVGGKFMQLLMNHGTDLPKFISRVSVTCQMSNAHSSCAPSSLVPLDECL